METNTAKPKRVTIHCSATVDGHPILVDTIRKWHQEKGWRDIGYHFLIQPNGEVQEGRKVTEIGAHVEGANRDNIGVCMIGNAKFSLEQFESLKTLVNDLCQTFAIKPWEIYTHNEFISAQKKGKTCPNMRITNLVNFIKHGNFDAVSEYLIGG